MSNILPQVEELISTLKQLMPTIYQQETLESIFGLLKDAENLKYLIIVKPNLKVQLVVFLNEYNWSTRSLIRTVRSFIINLILSTRKKRTKNRFYRL